MKRWLKKAEALGARMTLRETRDGWMCCLVPNDTPQEPFLRPRTGFASLPARDDTIRAAFASYIAGGVWHRAGDPVFRTYTEHRIHHQDA